MPVEIDGQRHDKYGGVLEVKLTEWCPILDISTK